MAKIIDGRLLAEKIKNEIVKEIFRLKGVKPNLAIILVSEREDSKLYTSLKEKEAKKVGIGTHLYKFSAEVSDREILETINFLNKDDLIDGILVQLPLPEQLDTDGIILAVDLSKDVDGFHPDNLKKLFVGNGFSIMPPVFGAILEMLASINYDLSGREVCVITNSTVFSESLVRVLKTKGAQVNIAKPDDVDLADKTIKADVLISAVGQARLIKKDMIKSGAVIIDVGICKAGNKTCGDVDFVNVKDKVSFITPVPGGVGPLTIAMAFKNTLELYKSKHNNM